MSVGQRDRVAERLQATLVDLIALALLAKQTHWNLTGPRCLALHPDLDEIVVLARRYADIVAKRAANLGTPPAGQPHTVAADHGIPPLNDGWIRDEDSLNELSERLVVLALRVRDRVDGVAEADPVTTDILTELVGELEKHAWRLRACR